MDHQQCTGASSWKRRSALAHVELFAGLGDEPLGEVLEASQLRRIPKGGILFEQETEAKTFFVLLDGRIKIAQITPDGQQMIVRFIGPGEQFGCVTAFGVGNYPGTATAVVDSVGLAWDKTEMLELMKRHSAVALNALHSAGDRLQETVSRLRELSTERVERRIAHTVLRLARQAGREVESGVEIEFPLSRQDVAEMTGATLHTVSRVISKWEQDGFVEGGRQRVVVRRPEALVRIAEDL
jgi:CRP-like cAMP-binding protein